MREQKKRKLSDGSDQSNKNGKSAGHEQITPVMIKSKEAKTTRTLTKLYNKAFQEGEASDDWKIGVIVPIQQQQGGQQQMRKLQGNNLDKHSGQNLRANK